MFSKLARASTFVFLPVLLLYWLPTGALAQSSSADQALEVRELHRDVSPPLRDIEPTVPRRGPKHQIPLLLPPRQAGPAGLYADPALQTTLGTSAATTGGNDFDGVGQGFGTYSVGVAPPDTNGAVGSTQYVQWVNTDFAVFNKTGGLLYGPAAGTTIWSGFPDACGSTNDGDVIAQYDKLANRWVMAQLSYSAAPPYLLCLAVSATNDATGSYYRYSYSYSGLLNDYPKLGIWPDGYYVTANMFKPILGGLLGYQYQGPEVCAFNRNSMLTGGASTPVCKGPLSTSYSSLLPADLDGANPPPAGSPHYLLALGTSNSLYLWKFHVDFSNTANSTLSGPTSIPVSSYNEACGGGTCIPQVGTSEQLDSLADRLMYRLAYRNLNGTQVLVANHSVATTVNGSSTAGIRWYEIRNPNGTPSVYQQSTWAPDTTYRWMGSIAMDKVGNIALGYSVSSGGIHPGIRYTGHQPAVDALNTMEVENSVIEGTGSQQSGLSRWGDYSAMAVDPVDDCTFWYTTEYLKTDGTFNWSTRIASFSFSSCTNAVSTPDFAVSANPTTQTITQGSSANYTITVTSLNGYSNTVNLSVSSGCPTGASCTLNPVSVPVPNGGSATSTLTVSGAGAGTYSGITVSASDGTLSHNTSVSLTVNPPVTPDFSISASPASVMIKRGSAGSTTITITPSGGFNQSVTLSASCPSGVSCNNFTPNPVGGGSGTSTMTIIVGSGVARATYTIPVTGTGGGISHSTNVSLKVR